MAQLTIRGDVERSLRELMRRRGIDAEAEAIRVAVQESLGRAGDMSGTVDFTSWLGAAKLAPENPSPSFRSDDDLWSAGAH